MTLNIMVLVKIIILLLKMRIYRDINTKIFLTDIRKVLS